MAVTREMPDSGGNDRINNSIRKNGCKNQGEKRIGCGKTGSGGFRYILRFAVQPGHHEEERFSSLLDFCKAALIDEVMFFINCEELNQGHLTMEETSLWMDVIRKGKKLLDAVGIKTSINPWSTLLHCDRGRKLKEGQEFNLMVDPYGNRASAVACSLCLKWRRYLSEMYSYYASIKPSVIWVEDDFRLHNHDPLIWGGCFCEQHMHEYSKRAGKKLSREDFVRGILQPGEVHPYRKIWLDVSRETMADVAEMLGTAVRKVSDETKVGLMSSDPAVHCAEARDWETLLKGLSAGQPPVIRPHLPSYAEVTPQRYIMDFRAISMMTCAFLPQTAEIYPELENYQHTRFAKSKAFTRFQVETSAIAGSHGITMNIFDMMGNGVLMNEGYQDILAAARPFVNQLAGLGLDVSKQRGIKIPICGESSYTLKTCRGDNMSGLYPRESFWAQLLTVYGVANAYTREKKHTNSIIAVSGQYFRNLSCKELTDLFNGNFIIMEGEAAYTLWNMGYGDLAGIAGAGWHRVNSGFQAYEEVCGEEIYGGIKNARMSSQGWAGDYLKIQYGENADYRIISEVRAPDGRVAGPGMVLCNHALILPYGHLGSEFYAHLNTTRQEIIGKLLRRFSDGVRPAMVLDAPYVSVFDYELDGLRVLLVVNASGDDFDEIRIRVAGDMSVRPEIYEINRNSDGIIRSAAEISNGILSFKSLKRLEVKAFVFVCYNKGEP